MIVSRIARILPCVVVAAALGATDAPVMAQLNLDRGKSAAQIFADTCNACGIIIPPARAKLRRWLPILPRSEAIRGPFSSGVRPHWGRGKCPRHRPIRASQRMVRQRRRGAGAARTRPDLGVHRRASKRGVSRLLPGKAAKAGRRKQPRQRRGGNPPSKSSRSSAPQSGATRGSSPLAPLRAETAARKSSRARAQTPFRRFAVASAEIGDAISSPPRLLPRSRSWPHASAASRSPRVRRRLPPPLRLPQRVLRPPRER
jgi:hypothetical protein